MTEPSEKKILEWKEKGLLFVVDSGGIEKFTGKRCHFTGLHCKPSCKLFKDNECSYELSLNNLITKDTHRLIDNEVLFDSPLIHPIKETSSKGDVVEGALQKRVGSCCIPLPTPFASSIKTEVNKIEKKIDEI